MSRLFLVLVLITLALLASTACVDDLVPDYSDRHQLGASRPMLGECALAVLIAILLTIDILAAGRRRFDM